MEISKYGCYRTDSQELGCSVSMCDQFCISDWSEETNVSDWSEDTSVSDWSEDSHVPERLESDWSALRSSGELKSLVFV